MKKTVLIGAMAAVAATASVIAVAPHAAAQPPECGSDPNMTTAYVDYSMRAGPAQGVWVACVLYTDVNHQCFSSGKAQRLYPRGEGPDPECRNIYNSR